MAELMGELMTELPELVFKNLKIGDLFLYEYEVNNEKDIFVAEITSISNNHEKTLYYIKDLKSSKPGALLAENYMVEEGNKFVKILSFGQVGKTIEEKFPEFMI
jgi:hypothetical protein